MRKTFIKTVKETKTPFIILLIIWIAYATLTILAPTTNASTRYGITVFQANLLRVTILLPYLLIWTAALFSILRFKKYTLHLKNAREKEGFRKIMLGLCMLLGVVVVPSLVGLISSHNPDTFQVQKIITILRNNITVTFYLLAFYFLWQASKNLLKSLIVKDKIEQPVSYLKGLIFAGVLGSAFVWFVTHNPFRTSSDVPTIRPTYYLEDLPIYLTIVVPYILIWFLGFLTIMNMRHLSRFVDGIIYRKIFSSVSKGLMTIIALVISLQFLSQATTYLSKSRLSFIILLIYVIFFALAAGYWYLARGAKDLSAIEEI